MKGDRALRLALLATAAASLVAGVLAGLFRLGGPAAGEGVAHLHALAMTGGFLGTVIGLERAVALGHPLGYAAPLASGFGAVLVLAGNAEAGVALLLAAPFALFGSTARLAWRQPRADTALLALAPLAWAAGNFAWVHELRSVAQAASWFAFLVLTITAERLEMTRLLPRRPVAAPLLAVAVAVLLGGAVGVAFEADEGFVAYGAGLAGLAAWLATFDIARRTILTHGFARYAAYALLAGYAWLAIAGIAWAALPFAPAARDTAMHALGLGFVFSMILAYGPIVVPAVAKVRVRFTAFFYAPLALLHASLALRLAFHDDAALRLTGGTLNAAAIALFALTMVASLRREKAAGA